MGFGLLAAVCSTIKTIELRNLTQTQDKTFYISRLAFATMNEAWIVLIVGCVPSLRPLMKAFVQKLWGSQCRIPHHQSFQIYTDQHDKYGKYSNHTRSIHTRFDREVQSLRGDQPFVYYHPSSDILELREARSTGSHNSNISESSWDRNGTIVKTTDISVRFDSKAADKV